MDIFFLGSLFFFISFVYTFTQYARHIGKYKNFSIGSLSFTDG